MAQIQAPDLFSGPNDVRNQETDRYSSVHFGSKQGPYALDSNAARRKQRPLGRQRRKNKMRSRG